MFRNIKRLRSQIMNRMKYIYILQLDESFIKEKVESSYSESTLKETR
jgi:hypothetical protein